MTVTWPSSLYPSGGFLGMCFNPRFDGGHLSSWLDKLTWHTVTCLVIWGRTGGECEHSTWQAQLDNLTCQVPLYSNASVEPWLFERATSFYQGTWEGSRREIESPKLPFTLDLIPQAFFVECTIPFLSFFLYLYLSITGLSGRWAPGQPHTNSYQKTLLNILKVKHAKQLIFWLSSLLYLNFSVGVGLTSMT